MKTSPNFEKKLRALIFEKKLRALIDGIADLAEVYGELTSTTQSEEGPGFFQELKIGNMAVQTKPKTISKLEQQLNKIEEWFSDIDREVGDALILDLPIFDWDSLDLSSRVQNLRIAIDEPEVKLYVSGASREISEDMGVSRLILVFLYEEPSLEFLAEVQKILVSSLGGL